MKNNQMKKAARNILECGGKRSATPLSDASGHPELLRRRGALPSPSKTWRGLVAALVFLFVTMTVHAQYSIDWSTIDGGGGTSTGGVYSVSGTIGQPDAGGPLTNGQYSVTGGFWSLISVVQTPGAPLLAITLAGNQAIVSWDSAVTGWTLQTNNDLATGAWGNYIGAVVNNRVTNSPPTGNLLFRLKQP